MEDKKYPCRTEKVNRITYRIRVLLDGKQRVSTSMDDKIRVDNYVNNFLEKFPNYTIEVKEEHWEDEVCIECGFPPPY